jgi:predicted transcriptional regulator
MSEKLMMPQEIEVWYIIPAIRRDLTKEMKKLGLNQKKIAPILGITEAAVSKYMTSKRAATVKFSKEIQKMIRQAAKNILKDKKTLFKETQTIIDATWKDETICELHKKFGNVVKCAKCF